MQPETSYRQRRHPRLTGYDYSTPGYYFVTLCVQARLPLFGVIQDGAVCLTPAGQMVAQAWRDLTAMHAGVEVDTLIVMPDHVHAIVILEDDPHRVLSLPGVIQRYKSLTTKRYAHAVGDQGWPRFAGKLWQESYRDHVIRKDEDLDEIRRYVVENPLRAELRRQGMSP